MTSLRVWLSRVRGSVGGWRRDADLADEISAHLALLAAEHIRRGTPPSDAAAAARREFGGVEQIKERYRDDRVVRWIDAIRQDLGYGVRQLRHNPVFAVVSIMSIALGISATTAVFSVIYPLLINPFPYRDADRMFWLAGRDKAGPVGPALLARAEFLDLQKVDSLDGAITAAASPMTVIGHDLSDAVPGERLSPNAFTYFGIPPLLGRTFTNDNALPGHDSVVVLSHRFWQRAFGGDPGAVGRSLRLDDHDYEIIGILPERFRGMFNNTELYVPLLASPNPNARLFVQVRLKAGTTRNTAEAALQPFFMDLAQAEPRRYSKDFRVHLMGLNDGAGDRYAGTLIPAFVGATLLLVVGCLNVSILFLARGAARQPELAIRRAIGAGRGRLIGQLLTESLLLALMGGALGVLLSNWAMPALLALWPSYVPADAVVKLNSPVLLFGTVAVLLAALAFGVSPALRLSRPMGGSFLVGNSRSTISHLQGRYLYPTLIAGQVALTMVLLAGAGAAARTLLQLYHVELGYSPQNVLRLTLLVPKGRYTTWAEREQFSDRVRAQISETADVESVTVGQVPPVAGGRNRVAFADRLPADEQFAFVQRVSRQYCSTLKIPIVHGRMWSEDDDARAAHLVVINQAMARRFWPSTDPIGQRIRLPDFTSAASWALPVQETTLIASLFGIFGCLALTLAAIGLYGVVSSVVTHRQGELAIRMALGAPRMRVVEIVLASTILAVSVGLTTGLLLSLATGRILAQWTGVAKPDLLVLVSVASVLLAVASLAALVPAHRAATVDPAVALRCS